MRQREIIRTTLGELIVALTDGVMPFIRDPLGKYTLVSYMLSDLLAQQHALVRKRSRQDNTRFARELNQKEMR